MYVQVARYRLGRASADELVPRIEEGNLPVMREVPGFVEYYALRLADNEVASVTVFRDRSGVEEAEERLGAWVERTVGEFDITPGEVSEGEVLVTTRK
jgi:Antibiotic biosynthesis monooxygenase